MKAKKADRTGKRYGYARVSTADQNLDVQRTALERAGVVTVFEEKISGTKRDGRKELDRALKIIGPGDALVVTRLDRLGRSMRDLSNIAHEIEEVGAHLIVTEQSVDTSTSAGRAFFGMLATFAQFETDVRRERQNEGILKAKAEGRYKGRPPTVDRDAVAALLAEGVFKTEIAAQLGIARSTVYRLIEEIEAEAS
ncbi:MAG: recombinase family protein [Alphaproteobacteria bacterium]|nr:recombinase family protein [Alphaproteobacteria bacterium]